MTTAIDDTGLWRTDRDYVRVKLRGLVVERKVGVHPWERHPERPNRLIIDIDLFSASYAQELRNGTPILDYDNIRTATRDWPALPHTLYLETVAEELFALCFVDARVEAVRLSIMKPDIFNEASGAGIELYRIRQS